MHAVDVADERRVNVVAKQLLQPLGKRTGNLAEFFAASPLRGSRLKVKRAKDRPRKVEL